MTRAAFLYFFAWMNIGRLNRWMNGFALRDLWMDVCVHVCTYVRVLDQAVPWHTQSPASHHEV